MKSLSYVSALLLAVVFAIAQVLAAPQQGTQQGTKPEGIKTEGMKTEGTKVEGTTKTEGATGITWGTTGTGTRVPMEDQSMVWDRPMMEEQAGFGYGRRPTMGTMCTVVWNFCNDRREAVFNRPSLNAMCSTVRNYCRSERGSQFVTRDVAEEVEAAQYHRPYPPYPLYPPRPYPPTWTTPPTWTPPATTVPPFPPFPPYPPAPVFPPYPPRGGRRQ